MVGGEDAAAGNMPEASPGLCRAAGMPLASGAVSQTGCCSCPLQGQDSSFLGGWGKAGKQLAGT